MIPVRSPISRVMIAFFCATLVVRTQQPSAFPSTPLHYGLFTVQFSPDGAFELRGRGWPAFTGTWKVEKGELTVVTPAVQDCSAPGRYGFRLDGGHLSLTLIKDVCEPRRMILHDSTWLPENETRAISARKIVRTSSNPAHPLPPPSSSAGELAVLPRTRGRRGRGRPALA